MLIQGEGGPRRPAQGRRYLERAAELGQISALECCRTHYRRALTVIGARAGEPDKSKARFDALACVIDNGQIRTLPKAGVVSLSPTQI